jgi:hypothetical protein
MSSSFRSDCVFKIYFRCGSLTVKSCKKLVRGGLVKLFLGPEVGAKSKKAKKRNAEFCVLWRVHSWVGRTCSLQRRRRLPDQPAGAVRHNHSGGDSAAPVLWGAMARHVPRRSAAAKRGGRRRRAAAATEPPTEAAAHAQLGKRRLQQQW